MMQDACDLLYQQCPKDIAVAICHAQPSIHLRDLNVTHLVQGDRVFNLALQNMATPVEKTLRGKHRHILLLPHKQVQQSCAWMAKAMLSLEMEGTLTVCCPNRMGARGYEKRLIQLAGSLIRSMSKKKCRLFSVKRTELLNEALAKEWQEAGEVQWVERLKLYSSPGIFSWDRPDKGSMLLLKHLPNTLAGIGMDVGCGHGILSASMIQKVANIKEVHLIDVFYPAIEAAKKNVQSSANIRVHFHHLDVVNETLPVQANWIVLNPPFHSGQQQDTGLGQQMIAKCCLSLKKGGLLYMVANRHLPYEHILRDQGMSFQELVCEKGFKVLRAEK